MKLEDLNAYKIICTKDLKIGLFGTKAWILRHKKTNARIALLENDDDNKVFNIVFRTPPKNSTGVAHIIEHSVLAGSEKYPLKDPFMELEKGSLNTFLNAITYSDHTAYPVASCNDHDFQNLMDVYLDAVFHPLIYKNKAIFLQEGWHYEIDENELLSYNGVVYNEMKGAYSDADDILYRLIKSSLYPDIAYSSDSGGDPKDIPQLSYEEFLEFHRKYYHPSNSYIYLYGNMDMAEKLDYIDRQYLNAYDAIEVDSEIGTQELFDQPRRLEKDYPVDSAEDEEEKAMLSLNFMIGDNMDPNMYLAFDILDNVICNQNGAPLKVALLDAGIGSDIYSMYNNGIKYPFFSIVAKDTDAENEKKFLEIIDCELRKIVEKGFDKKTLHANLNASEFKYLEADYGRYPRGLMYGLQMLDSWLYDDSKPFIHLEANETYKYLHKMIETDYFEKLVEKYLLNNIHRTIVLLKPKAGLLDIEEENLNKHLEVIRSEMTQEQFDEIRRDNELLTAFQDKEDQPEDLRKIPSLGMNDLEKKAFRLVNETLKIDEFPCLYHDVKTNEIGYLNLSFDLKEIPAEYYPFIGVLRILLFDVSTEHFTYGELSNEILLSSGGMGASISIVSSRKSPDECRKFFNINTRYRYENLDDVMKLIQEVIRSSRLDDEKRVLEILREYVTTTQEEMISSGHLVAVDRALSYDNIPSAYHDILAKMSLYNLISDYVEHFEEKKKELFKRVQMLSEMIFRSENLMINFTGDRKELTRLEKSIRVLKEAFYDCDVPKGRFVPRLEKKNEGFMASSQVQYVCRAGNFRKANLPYTGSLRVLRAILASEYLWTNVRVKNGAYGCMCSFSSSGESYLVSYRDPHLKKTLDVYENTVSYIQSFDADETTMAKYIIGAIGELDIPKTPVMKGNYSRDCYLADITQEDLQKERDELLNTNPEKIRELAGYMEAILKQNCFVVTGNSTKIKENKNLFKSIKNLF